MIYIEAIKKLNNMSPKEIEENIAKIENSEAQLCGEAKAALNSMVGSLFSASKEVKAEELYRVKFGETMLENYDLFWETRNGYINFCADPITPFIDGNVSENSVVTLLTYRKAAEGNPLALMLEGFSEDSAVFGILEKDGLTENGKQNYIKICSFLQKELNKPKVKNGFIDFVMNVLTDGNGVDAYCYSSCGSEYFVFRPEYVKTYYRCTSSILCRLVSVEGAGDKLQIEPIKHNNCEILPGKRIEYDDFGEVGNFTFEMTDYR